MDIKHKNDNNFLLHCVFLLHVTASDVFRERESTASLLPSHKSFNQMCNRFVRQNERNDSNSQAKQSR